MKIALIIPTLNEIDGMKEVLPKINKDWVDEIIIVDGGSTDWTIEEAKKQNLTVINQKTKGKRQVKGSKKNANSKIKSKAAGKANMSGIRKVGRGN